MLIFMMNQRSFFHFIVLLCSSFNQLLAASWEKRKMTGSVMEKSIGIVFLQVMGAMVVYGLSVAGTGSASSIMNNSLNPYSPSTSGSILSSSTAPSMLETYLQTFPINEQQNILTTVYHASAKHQTSTMGAEREKLTTSSASSFSSTTHLATESSQTFSPSNQNTQMPFLISTGASASSSLPTTTMNLSENPEQAVLIEPILLGCGPNNREGIGIQKALDWLREKRVSDFGWENDTHMVILAKEVSDVVSSLSRLLICHSNDSFPMVVSRATPTGTYKLFPIWKICCLSSRWKSTYW